MKSIIFWAISQHEKWMLCYNERYPLMRGCFISLLIWITKLTGASASIYKPLMVHIMSFVPKTTFKIHEIYLEFRFLLRRRFCMWCCKERHPLLLNCLINFLRCIRRIQCALNSTYKPLMVHTTYVISTET